MPLPTDEQIARLPRWARNEIERLRRDNEHYQARLREGPEDSRVFADAYSGAARPLGRDPIIEFHLPLGKVRVKIAGDFGGEYVDVSTDANAIQVQPQAANVCKIRPGGWW